MALEDLLDEIDVNLVLESAARRCTPEKILLQYKVNAYIFLVCFSMCSQRTDMTLLVTRALDSRCYFFPGSTLICQGLFCFAWVVD